MNNRFSGKLNKSGSRQSDENWVWKRSLRSSTLRCDQRQPDVAQLLIQENKPWSGFEDNNVANQVINIQSQTQQQLLECITQQHSVVLADISLGQASPKQGHQH